MPPAAILNRAEATQPDSVLPVSVVAGYLGSGKTTLINRLLRGSLTSRFAVLVNDFGELNIDARLIESTRDRTISLTNGCICCAMADDLGAAFDSLSKMRANLDHVLMEASGVADAVKLGRNADTWPGFRLQQIITLVDAFRTRDLVADKYVGEHVKRQLTESSRLLISKTDLLTSREIEQFLFWLAGVTPLETTVTTDLDVNALLDNIETKEIVTMPGTETSHPRHNTIMFTAPEPIARERIESWLSGLPRSRLRVKGFLRLQENPRASFVLQLVDAHHSITPNPNSTPLPDNQLVVIGEDVTAIPDPFREEGWATTQNRRPAPALRGTGTSRR